MSAVCAISVHVRCIANVQVPCTQHQNALGDESISLRKQFYLSHVSCLNSLLAPSMFGRDLTEQVRADSKYEERQVPVIVEKCIEAVEARGELPLVTACKIHTFICSKRWNMKESIGKLEARVNRRPSLRCLNEEIIPLSIFATQINLMIFAALHLFSKLTSALYQCLC